MFTEKHKSNESLPYIRLCILPVKGLFICTASQRQELVRQIIRLKPVNWQLNFARDSNNFLTLVKILLMIDFNAMMN